MSFSIGLASPAPHFYSPGDLVCGTVSLDAVSDAAIESVAITFSGYSNVTIGPNQGQVAPKPTARRSDHTLFRHQQLLQGSHRCGKGNSVWPFRFRLPNHVQLEIVPNGSCEPFCQSPWRSPHDAEVTVLPPSMRCAGVFTCSVEYVLVARLIRPPHAHLFGNEDLTARRTLRVRPGRLSDVPYVCMGNTKTLLFQHEIPMKSCPSVAKNWFVSKTRSESGVSASPTSSEVFFCVQIPSIMDVRNLASNKFTISATSDSASAIRQQIQISRYRIELAVHTRVRTETARHAETGVIVLMEGTTTTEIRKQRANGFHPQTPATHGGHEHELAEDEVAAIPLTIAHKQICDLPPEFACLNIFRAYTLNYCFRLQYGSTKASFENRDIPISIADGTLTKAQEQHMPRDIADTPPSYEHAVV